MGCGISVESPSHGAIDNQVNADETAKANRPVWNSLDIFGGPGAYECVSDVEV